MWFKLMSQDGFLTELLLYTYFKQYQKQSLEHVSYLIVLYLRCLDLAAPRGFAHVNNDES